MCALSIILEYNVKKSQEIKSVFSHRKIMYFF